jgi:hypothetical protein
MNQGFQVGHLSSVANPLRFHRHDACDTVLIILVMLQEQDGAHTHDFPELPGKEPPHLAGALRVVQDLLEEIQDHELDGRTIRLA